MNKDRRKALKEAVDQLETAKTALDLASSLIETAKDEEQEFFDNMPESFQQADKGQAAEAAVSALGDAINEIESAVDHIEGAL